MEQPIQAHRAELTRYLEEMARWNARTNLTAVPPGERWTRHVEESARLLAAAAPAAGQAVVDVGSGSGAPGLVVAILRPDLAVTLLEADTRKAAFLDHAAGELRLGNVRVAPRRAEDAGRDPGMRECHDLALARAVAAPAVLCELALPLVRPGGRLLALVSDAAQAAEECAAAAAVLGGGPPQGEGGILTVAKAAPTPERFPRRPGTPRRLPLG
ncbi:MAG: 16S rRNA (guanine(527)-N(7))-methyltransferase RsmG [Candidatus Dormibacteraeota bacterium]|nr:16S rRNA (guanine(527)-N(7))-methyltransferase RsmG [Candidatus Dormibacteraeota bacterium]MBV9524360.1 16S rRNA (guanine(527)-N(7))-methyltransferase RsmG [Candidatus Dormibacteraeota bacterium]